ncbi:MAG: phosphoenolpyruvate--protein phosphotransferase [Planctomycetota bacterium]
MRIVRGIQVSNGIAIGRAFVLEDAARRVSARWIQPGEVETELERLDNALERSRADLNAVYAEAQREMGDEAAKIFLFHLGMLSDPSLVDPMRALVQSERVSAETAVDRTFRELEERFASMPDTAFQTKVNDIEDLADRVLATLGGQRLESLTGVEEDTIIIARDLTPTQTAGFDRNRVIGMATDLGGRTSHTAIVARALGMPAVVGCRELLDAVPHGAAVIIDGDRGSVIIQPDEDTLDRYKGYIEQQETYRLGLRELADMPSVTTDEVEVTLQGNIEFPGEIGPMLELGGSGVGLYRTEFLFLTGATVPTEQDHFEAYTACLDALGPDRALVIRTVDLGADKYTQAQAEFPERNPFLGNRSIRYCLRSLPMFKTQLRAILRASALGNVRIMFPLVSTLAELRHARMILRDVMEDLDEQGVGYDHDLKVGMMVEVPSAAVMARSFAKEVDFFSIGTNDLVQYTLAVDRTNERVANLYQPANPAVLRMIREVVRAGRNGKISVSCCGEAAGDPEYALLLIGLGVRTLSVTGSSVPALKRLVRSVSIKQCERVARKAMSFDSEVEVSAYLRSRARKLVPEAFDGRAVEDRA